MVYDIDFMEPEIEIILSAFSYIKDDNDFIIEDNPYCSSEAINNVWNKIESNYINGDFNYSLSSNELTILSIVLGNYIGLYTKSDKDYWRICDICKRIYKVKASNRCM